DERHGHGHRRPDRLADGGAENRAPGPAEPAFRFRRVRRAVPATVRLRPRLSGLSAPACAGRYRSAPRSPGRVAGVVGGGRGRVLAGIAGFLKGVLPGVLSGQRKTPAEGRGFWGKAPGDDLLLHGLGHTTIGAAAFHFRVRDGIGWFHSAMVAREGVEGRADARRLTRGGK